MEIDGATCYRPAEKPAGGIKITENLQNLLLAMRTEDTYVTLWIHSICINQSDVDENTEPVKIMSLIYENAYSTIGYIGEQSRNRGSHGVREEAGCHDRLAEREGPSIS